MPGISAKGIKTGASMRSAKGPRPDPKISATSGWKLPNFSATRREAASKVSRKEETLEINEEESAEEDGEEDVSFCIIFGLDSLGALKV
jgi:hypothetical protein